MTDALTQAEISAHYAVLAAEYGISFSRRREQHGLTLEQDIRFLNELKPVLDSDTEDSHSILDDIVHCVSEEQIRKHLALQQHIEDATYDDVKYFYGAFPKYIGKGMLRKPKKLYADVEKLVALYRVTEALRQFQERTGYDPKGPLNRHYELYWIKDEALLTFVLDNHQHWETIVKAIRTGGVYRVPALEFVISGGASAVTTGAL